MVWRRAPAPSAHPRHCQRAPCGALTFALAGADMQGHACLQVADVLKADVARLVGIRLGHLRARAACECCVRCLSLVAGGLGGSAPAPSAHARGPWERSHCVWGLLAVGTLTWWQRPCHRAVPHVWVDVYVWRACDALDLVPRKAPYHVQWRQVVAPPPALEQLARVLQAGLALDMQDATLGPEGGGSIGVRCGQTGAPRVQAATAVVQQWSAAPSTVVSRARRLTPLQPWHWGQRPAVAGVGAVVCPADLRRNSLPPFGPPLP